MGAIGLHRQRWVHLRPKAIAPTGDADLDELLDDWITRGYPTVVARRMQDDMEAGRVRLGIPLPTSMGRARVSVSVPRSAIAEVRDPPYLHQIRYLCPRPWLAAVDGLLAAADACRTDVYAFGSLAWQAATGLDYLRPSSDLDILFRPPGNDYLDTFLSALNSAASEAFPLDGECWRADGMGVHWRELLGRSHQVVAKADDGLHVMDRTTFLAGGTP